MATDRGKRSRKAGVRINYNAAQNASTVTPACSISPRSVPGLIGLCIGTTTVRLSFQRMACDPVCRRSTKPSRRRALTASEPLTSRGIFTRPQRPDRGQSEGGRARGPYLRRNIPPRRRKPCFAARRACRARRISRSLIPQLFIEKLDGQNDSHQAQQRPDIIQDALHACPFAQMVG